MRELGIGNRESKRTVQRERTWAPFALCDTTGSWGLGAGNVATCNSRWKNMKTVNITLPFTPYKTLLQRHVENSKNCSSLFIPPLPMYHFASLTTRHHLPLLTHIPARSFRPAPRSSPRRIPFIRQRWGIWVRRDG